MTTILLAEHSPHAQRMGERILREEGYSVITVSDGETALLRLKDVRPQLVLADIGLKGFTGLEISKFVKNQLGAAGPRVVLTMGALELLDEKLIETSKADGVLRKPFEASALLEMAARFASAPVTESRITDRTDAAETAQRPTRTVVVLDPDQVRAAVTVALDESLEPLISRVTERVIAALTLRK